MDVKHNAHLLIVWRGLRRFSEPERWTSELGKVSPVPGCRQTWAILLLRLLLLIAFIERCSLLSNRRTALFPHVIPSKWLAFLLRILNIHRSGVRTELTGCYMIDATWNCCRLGVRSVCTIQPCTSLRCKFIRSHRRSVRVCLGVTCHLQFWENDRDLSRATAVTRGWNAYQKYELAKKVHPGEETSPVMPVGTRTQDLSIASPTLYHCAIPAPPKRGGL